MPPLSVVLLVSALCAAVLGSPVLCVAAVVAAVLVALVS